MGIGHQTPTLSFPDYLHLSKNYFRLGWSLNSHRRLKNLIIVMDWVPDMTVTFGEEDEDDEGSVPNPAHAELEDFLSTPDKNKNGDGPGFLQSVTDAFQESVEAFAQATKRKRRIKSAWKPRELTKEQEAGLQSAFTLFDDAGIGRLDESQLREVLRSADACVGGDEAALSALARRIAKNSSGGPDAGVTLEDLKNAVRNMNMYGIQDGRYYVALSLAEAESLRAAMHGAKRERMEGAGDGTLVPFASTEVGLRLAAPGGGGALIEATSGYEPAELFQAATATQCFRFVDSQVDFEDHELSLLLRSLQGNTCADRAEFFERVRAVRRRAKTPWQATPLAKALTTADEFAMLASRATSARVRAALRRNKMRLLDAFRAFDGEQLGRLTYEGLYGGLTWLGMDITPTQMMELAGKIDLAGDGFISFEEFTDAFGPDDYVDNDRDDNDNGDLSASVSQSQMQSAAMDDDIFGLNALAGANAGVAADPLGALASGTQDASADGWGGDEDLINFDGAQGAGRVRIEARSLAGKSPHKKQQATSSSDGPRPPVSRDPATLGVPLSREILSGFRLALKQHAAYERVWMSEGSGCRRAASFWNAKIETSSFARNRDRISLGSYAVPAYHDPTKAVGQPANALEIADAKAWSMTGSTHMPNVIDALFPHPVRFRQVWGQEWRHTAAYAWAAVPPPGFSALGMVLSGSSAPPPLESLRCVPTSWTCAPQSQPRLVWDNGGGGGRPASAWIVNSLGTAHVTVGFDAPTHADGILELVPASRMLPEDVLDPGSRSDGANTSSRRGSPAKPGSSFNADDSKNTSAGLRGRAAMFESVAREQREREEEATRRAQASLNAANANAASGNDLLTGAVDFLTGGPDPDPPPRHAVDHRQVYEAWLEEDERPTHNQGDPFGASTVGGGSVGNLINPNPKPAAPNPRGGGPPRTQPGGGQQRKDVNPFARMDPLGGLGGLGVPASAPAINPPPSNQTRDLLSGDSLDPLGVLSAGAIREKPKDSFFTASKNKQIKKKD